MSDTERTNTETTDTEGANTETTETEGANTETTETEGANAETNDRDGAGATATDGTDGAARDGTESDVAVELAVLREENRRLRAAYQQAQRTTYRRTALGFLAVGALAALGGVAFPDARTVLFALAGAGLFAGVLAYYLTPEQFVAADIAHDVYGALADTGGRLVDELGLTARRLYVPADGAQTAWLYVPQSRTGTVPDTTALESLFVLGDEQARGVSLQPTGSALFERFERGLSGSLATDPDALATQLADGVVEQFELARSVHADVSRRGNGGTASANGTSDGHGATDTVVSFGVADPTIGSLDRFDHPIPSFLAVGLARGVDAPVAIETTSAEGDRADFVVTCRVGSTEWN